MSTKFKEDGSAIIMKPIRTKPRIGVWFTKDEPSQKFKNDKKPKFPKQDIYNKLESDYE